MNNLIILIITPLLFWISSACLFFVFHNKKCPTNLYLIPLILVGMISLLLFLFTLLNPTSLSKIPFNTKDYLFLSLFSITFIIGQWLSLYMITHASSVSSFFKAG